MILSNRGPLLSNVHKAALFDSLSDQAIWLDVLEWAEDIVVSYGLLENALEGKMQIVEMSDGRPTFRMTDTGNPQVKAFISQRDTDPTGPRYHGSLCPKKPHIGEGYLHSEHDDRPYRVDGLLYCGRCHGSIDE